MTQIDSLLIAGGASDPNLTRLIEVATLMGISIRDARHHPETSPAFSWRLSGGATLNGQPLAPRGAFLRYDVHDQKPQAAQRSAGWYQAMYGWLLSQPDIRLFNRQQQTAVGNKPALLMLAQQQGLTIPSICITNDAAQLAQFDAKEAIAKPVAGGDFCYPLDDLLRSLQPRHGCSATPAIVQNRLVAPEIRVYVVGDRTFAFEVQSPSLDYRVKQDVDLVPLDSPQPEVEKLRALMAALRMDFGAADFKTDPKTQRLAFLELNSSPMFVRFDQVVEGALCRAMVQALMTSTRIELSR